jgi:hypothetical protein
MCAHSKQEEDRVVYRVVLQTIDGDEVSTWSNVSLKNVQGIEYEIREQIERHKRELAMNKEG